MRDHHFFMCTTPHGEHCAQVGACDYETNARVEADAFIDQLRRVYGSEPSGSYYKVVECTHDFGIYLDIRFNFDDEIQSHVAYLTQIQDSVEHWDNIAKDQLKRAGSWPEIHHDSYSQGCLFIGASRPFFIRSFLEY